MIVFTSDVSILSFGFVGVKTINHESINQGIVTDLLSIEARNILLVSLFFYDLKCYRTVVLNQSHFQSSLPFSPLIDRLIIDYLVTSSEVLCNSNLNCLMLLKRRIYQ